MIFGDEGACIDGCVGFAKVPREAVGLGMSLGLFSGRMGLRSHASYGVITMYNAL